MRTTKLGGAPGYVTNGEQHVSLAEGETRGVIVVLRTPPPPIKVARPFQISCVKAFDGQVSEPGRPSRKVRPAQLLEPLQRQ